MQQLLIMAALFGGLWFILIRPQRAKAQRQQSMLGQVAVGDEILTVGGIYGIVQELEPDEDGGDLIVEIADGIHVRIARKALATVIKPDEEDEEDEEDEDEEEGEDDGEDAEDGGDDEPAEGRDDLVSPDSTPTAGVEEVNDEGESVNPGAADQPAASERS